MQWSQEVSKYTNLKVSMITTSEDLKATTYRDIVNSGKIMRIHSIAHIINMRGRLCDYDLANIQEQKLFHTWLWQEESACQCTWPREARCVNYRVVDRKYFGVLFLFINVMGSN
jgi:hypothetical protein